MPLLSLEDAADAGIHYPWLEAAKQYIIDQGVATADAVKKMPAQMARKTFTVRGIDSVGMLYQMKQAVADAVSKGLTGEHLRDAVSDVVTLSKSQADTIIRTQSKGAMLSQWSKTIEKPVIKKAFPYVMYMPTLDSRTRPWHAAMKGFVCEVGSDAYQVCLDLQAEPNCRCGFRALTDDQAEKYTIKDASQLPAIVQQRGY
jgi:SPP1 gp7 family putative phage head morphogenesis protein